MGEDGEGGAREKCEGLQGSCTHLTLGVQRVKLEGQGLHVSSISPETGRKVKRNGLRQRELV